MKTTLNILLFLALAWNTANAQVGIGTITPDASAALDVVSTDKGFLPPRMSTADRDLISSPAGGLTIYNTTVNCIQFYNNNVWINICDKTIASGACAGEPIEFTFNGLTYKPVANAGRCWLDRNLGANQVATSSTDAAAYGDLYQWGRAADGHEKVFRVTGDAPTSSTTTTEATTAVPNAGNPWDGLFIIRSQMDTPGWLTPQDDNLWQGASGINNPCPAGFRLPTETEWNNERLSWSDNNANGAYGSPLKLPLTGYRNGFFTSGLIDEGNTGYYYTSTVSGSASPFGVRSLRFDGTVAEWGNVGREMGEAVRCLKD